MSRRGAVLIVNFPFSDGSGSKNRPALVIQNDADNQRLQNTVLAMITGNISHAHEATQFWVDPSTQECRNAGLRGPSVVKCSVLVTVAGKSIIRRLGHLSPAALQRR